MLVIQTGIDLVCGPDGELCVCYHNGWELHRGEMVTVADGDFIVCWFDSDPKETTGSCAVAGLLLFGVEAETYPSLAVLALQGVQGIPDIDFSLAGVSSSCLCGRLGRSF